MACWIIKPTEPFICVKHNYFFINFFLIVIFLFLFFLFLLKFLFLLLLFPPEVVESDEVTLGGASTAACGSRGGGASEGAVGEGSTGCGGGILGVNSWAWGSNPCNDLQYS